MVPRVPGYNLLNLGPTGFATFHSEFAQWYHGTWVPRSVKFIKFRPYGRTGFGTDSI